MRTRPRVALIVALVALAAAGAALALMTAPARGSRAKSTTSTGMTMGGMPMPVPIQPIGTARWQGMKIQARLSMPVPFVVFEGTSGRMVKPTKREDVHLMVMLSDAQTGAAIPYGSVWATVRKAGKIVFDERLWPMISRFMGTHFGNNVALPGSGTYTVSLLIGPPQAARHIEYSKVWLKPHRVSMTFHWNKPK
ncbi:MAG: iron transporter [Gaiellaceae bacterium]